MSSLIDEYIEYETETVVREMTAYDRERLIEWIDGICQKFGAVHYPPEMIPRTGLAVRRGSVTLAVGLLCLEQSSRLAVFGFCVSNPRMRGKTTADAVKMILEGMPEYARSKGACALMSCFGHIGINRLLDLAGYMNMELNETKIIRL